MTEAALQLQEHVEPTSSAKSVWLAGPVYDLAFFHFSALCVFAILIPYSIWGSMVLYPLFIIQSVIFGTPHMYLTVLSVYPRSSYRQIHGKVLIGTVLVALLGAFCFLLPTETRITTAVISLTFFTAVWHANRQHSGIAKLYDFVLSERWGDTTLSKDMRAMHWLYALLMNALIVFAFTRSEVKYWDIPLIYPQLPTEFLYIYGVVVSVIAVLAIKNAILNRWKSNKRIPWPQLTLMALTSGVIWIPYFFIKKEMFFNVICIATGTAHHIQYYGFVWLFERKRVEHLTETNQKIDRPQTWIQSGKWQYYFGFLLCASLVTALIYYYIPPVIYIALTYFISLLHYVGDGFIWRRSFNKSVEPVSKRLVSG